MKNTEKFFDIELQLTNKEVELLLDVLKETGSQSDELLESFFPIRAYLYSKLNNR